MSWWFLLKPINMSVMSEVWPTVLQSEEVLFSVLKRYLTQILFVCCLKCFTELRQLLRLLIRADHTDWSLMCWSCWSEKPFSLSWNHCCLSVCVWLTEEVCMCLSGHVTCVFPLSPSCGPGCGSVTDTNWFGSSLSSSWSVHEQDVRSPDLWLLYLFVLVFISLTITQLTDLLIMSVGDLLIVINFEKTVLF